MLPWIIVGVCVLGMLLMVIRNRLLKADLNDLTQQLESKLNDDTNVLLYVSGRSKQLRNIAARLNRQLDLLRKQQLQYQHGNTELKNAVINISHDLRTPLTAICGYLYMIRKTDNQEQINSYLAIIAERTETMKQLTEELFRYSVILSDESDMKTEEVNVGQVLEDSIMGYYGALNEKGIVPNVAITENKIIRNLNKPYLSRIFSNLLNNALKYSDGDLNITLSDNGEITFSNTAKGLSSVQVEQFFDRFYTVEVARNSTGLGLSIARTLVERMGGTITAEYDDNRLTIKIIF